VNWKRKWWRRTIFSLVSKNLTKSAEKGVMLAGGFPFQFSNCFNWNKKMIGIWEERLLKTFVVLICLHFTSHPAQETMGLEVGNFNWKRTNTPNNFPSLINPNFPHLSKSLHLLLDSKRNPSQPRFHSELMKDGDWIYACLWKS